MVSIFTHLNSRCLLGLLLYQPFFLFATNQYEQIDYGQQRISITYPASFTVAERELTHQWLTKVTGALVTVYSELPKDSFRIEVKRNASSSSPVPWGHIERGIPTTVLLEINPAQGYHELLADWTAFHELSHLLIPYEGFGDVWFSEGLATYYQNVIQARSGLISNIKMWEKIAAGFERGRREQHWSHINLTEVSNNLGETRQYMRVHWSGVLYWLNVDIELRRGGKSNLDQALRKLKICCENRSMTARAIADKLDNLTGTNIFSQNFNKYSKSFHIPDYKPVLFELGILTGNKTGGISLTNEALLANLREEILNQSR